MYCIVQRQEKLLDFNLFQQWPSSVYQFPFRREFYKQTKVLKQQIVENLIKFT